ncbi:MAG: SDR family oxidoreductase [Paenibacillus macerans]|uniref:SDR family oxidoreductase n=1 Tax=Paenibacillus macerans TaxID=44252 RepID=A0A090ZI85_PAEMA|nr:SDR family oxidoreductase [Paenibacillus macerans]KFN09955.1 short chain dehydrogenase family protein [Paenibacillus macerans]MBS5912864.1 SDR family oxidoreductase [Paenibacillus macerans]MCY7560939.1 SDR family oxidoreductase [Paenibacillus macerans]MDU7473402.1 SDR family oxidoreductase [Paenibacillus macerans]MEC0138055.1 SDR family oxidoreductase [Paenibacillus macerans]
MDLGLKGKRAIITGGSKGIGLATALTLAGEGAQVALVARGLEALKEAEAKLMEQTGVKPLILQADVSSESEARRAVERAAEQFGGIDILVNNAGTSAAQPFEQVDSEAWGADLHLKLFGAVNFARAAIPHMRKSGSGAILNVTAISGKTPGASSLPTSVSRAAGLALTKAMSKDLARDNIRVNAVCIGLIRSDQIERKWKATAPELTWEQFAADPRFGIPLGRIGRAEEAAKVIAFLVSDAASYVTGTAVNIDGGSAAVL